MKNSQPVTRGFTRSAALLLALVTGAHACKPKQVAAPRAAVQADAPPVFYQARQQTFAQAAHAEQMHADDPNATEDTPEPQAVLEARADSAAIQGINEAFEQAEVQSETMNLIGLTHEACKNTLKEWANSNDDRLTGSACVGAYIGTFILIYYGAQKLSRFVKPLPLGAPLHGFLKSVVLDPVQNLPARTREFFAAHTFPAMRRDQAIQVAESMKPTYLQASAAVSLRNQQWASHLLATAANDTDKLFADMLTLEAALQTKSRHVAQLLESGADHQTITTALADMRKTQFRHVAHLSLMREAQEALKQQISNNTADERARALYQKLATANSDTFIFNEQVRLQRRLASLTADATELRKLRALPPTPDTTKMISELDARMASNAATAIESKNIILLNQTDRASSTNMRVGNYDDVLDSIEDLAKTIPDDPKALRNAAEAFADETARGITPTAAAGAFGEAALDASKGGSRFGKALTVGGTALFKIGDAADLGLRTFQTADLLREQRPGKAALNFAFAVIPYGCGAAAAVVSGGVGAVPAMIGCNIALSFVEGAIGGELDRRWEQKLDRQGTLNELALLGECRSTNATSEACREILMQSEEIVQRALNVNTTGPRAISEQQVHAIANGQQEAPPPRVLGRTVTEPYNQARYICTNGSEGGRNFVAGEKILLRKSDIENRSVSAVKVKFAIAPQGPFIVSKSKMCLEATFRPDVAVRENTTTPGTLTTDRSTLTQEQQRRGRCILKIKEDAGEFAAFNCAQHGATLSARYGNDYTCQRSNVKCRCHILLQRVLENQMKVSCEHQLGTWEAY